MTTRWLALLATCVAVQALDLHIIAHTHLDPGWLKTVDQYYMGDKLDVHRGGVQYILDSVITALERDPTRVFNWVEMSFFIRWWNQQEPERQTVVRDLVRTGRLSFLHGAWCMNDEATTHYTGIVDQITMGHQFIKNTFGASRVPKVAWHIDPFGHSAQMASLLHDLGYEAWVMTRIDSQDKDIRRETQEMEFMWQPSPSRPDVELMSVFTYGHYSPPEGFCWDQYCDGSDGSDSPIQDDERLFDMNAQERTDEFVELMKAQAEAYRTDNLLVLFGDDFHWENAERIYKNIDKLMHWIHSHPDRYPGINVFYSTPGDYVKAVRDAQPTLPVYQEDFFPYADGNHTYWSGYFVSRPTMKRMGRKANFLLQACQQLNVLDMRDDPDEVESLFFLQESVALMQHHDGLTGTMREHVRGDYEKRMAVGVQHCINRMSQAFASMTDPDGTDDDAHLVWQQCPMANVSVCEPISSANTDDATFALLVYNPTAHLRSGTVTLPVPNTNVRVVNGDGDVVSSVREAMQVYPDGFEHLITGADGVLPMDYTLSFQASDIPPLGASTYFLEMGDRMVDTAAPACSPVQRTTSNEKANVVLRKGDVEVVFAGVGVDGDMPGQMLRITNLETGVAVEVQHSWGYYDSSDGSGEDDHPSGAYIMVVREEHDLLLVEDSVSMVDEGSVLEIGHSYADAQGDVWVRELIRVTCGAGPPVVEVDHTVGPIPVDDGVGKEVFMRLSTDLRNHSPGSDDFTIFTDANGRQMQRRVFNYRPWGGFIKEPIPANYYPVQNAAYIQDEDDSTDRRRLTLVGDRSEGVASLGAGLMEVMVHRRCLFDDHKGMAEALDEVEFTGAGLISRGVHMLTVDSVESSPRHQRHLQHAINQELVVALRAVTSTADYANSHPLVIKRGTALHEGLDLQTVQLLDENNILIRVAHKFESREMDQELTFDPTVLVRDLPKIKDVREVTLSAIADVHSDYSTLSKVSGNWQAVVAPMEIRSYLLRIGASDASSDWWKPFVAATTIFGVGLFAVLYLSLRDTYSRAHHPEEFENEDMEAGSEDDITDDEQEEENLNVEVKVESPDAGTFESHHPPSSTGSLNEPLLDDAAAAETD